MRVDTTGCTNVGQRVKDLALWDSGRESIAPSFKNWIVPSVGSTNQNLTVPKTTLKNGGHQTSFKGDEMTDKKLRSARQSGYQSQEEWHNILVLQAHRKGVPEHIVDGLCDYIVYRVKAGSFLTAVLENNLKESFARADEFNRDNLFNTVSFLYNHAPGACWGSPENVKAWLEETE